MIERKTVFSPCRAFRYTLWREWSDLFTADDSYLMVIGLNPSTADEVQNDPTITRCVDFAKRWGFGALCMTNLFAYRATNPEDMLKQVDPVGEENDAWLNRIAAGAGKILAAWGTNGRAYSPRDGCARSFKVCSFGWKMECLSYNADGSPQHPLYVAKTAVLKPWPKP